MKKLFFTGFLALLSFTVSAQKLPFTETLYQQYQDNNEVFLVDIFAKWCPTCKKQSLILDKYFTDHPKSSLKVLVVDFDEQKDWVSHFRAPRQSTLLLYKGPKQIWFSVAETNENKIVTQLQHAEQ
ncbi:thioredoxin family protein [Pseudoalteromonas xiamenensis]|uniref:thioredoxin family protein n=1 Tax=Pseudoalteromonas xiamenensis TaxID=882626 RepID=UPI0027E4DD44|nr:thioredoxin family protein [Pseudoalteromonas xiamenensis]WMN60872.1 thioredoxin family protein [Pseudoalteromonas xiamenensis]